MKRFELTGSTMRRNSLDIYYVSTKHFLVVENYNNICFLNFIYLGLNACSVFTQNLEGL